MNGLSETMANSLTHSLTRLLTRLLAHLPDPPLRCKLFPHIYAEITNFDLVNYPNPKLQSDLMIGQLNRS